MASSARRQINPTTLLVIDPVVTTTSIAFGLDLNYAQ